MTFPLLAVELEEVVRVGARQDVEAEIAGAEEAAHKARVQAGNELRHQRREATVETVQAKLRERRERLWHLVHH